MIREPSISKQDIQIIRDIIQQKPDTPKDAWSLIKKRDLTDEQQTNIKYYVINSQFALGRLEPLFHDSQITEIICEGVGNFIRIKRDNQILKTNIIFKDKEDIDSFMKKLAKRFEKTLDENNPIIEAVHRDYRFHLILGLHGASSKFTIKKIE